MEQHKTVSQAEWIEARKALLAKEKDFTRRRDALARERRALPWTKVEKDYVFHGPDGKETLSDLFDGRGQLIVYHFMFGPGWGEGCKSCSLLADHFEPAVVHLKQRDVTLVAVSRAPFAEFRPFKERMGWTFKWVSSSECDFNRDFDVSFSQEEVDSGEVYYNFHKAMFPSTEGPGVSVFAKDGQGAVFRTYSTYARGLDTLINAYNYLDLVPKGRGEEGFAFTMEWVRHHDRYGE